MIPTKVEEEEKAADEVLKALIGEEGKPEEKPEEKPAETAPEGDEAPAPKEAEPIKKEEEGKEKDAAYWEQRFKVVEGKLKKEVPALTEALKTKDAQMGELSTKLTTLESQISELTAAKTAETENKDGTTATSDEIIANLKEEYGAEFTAAVEKVAERKAEAIVEAKFKSFEKNVKDNVDNTVDSKTQGLEYKRLLANAVSDVETINTDPYFHAYLNTNIDETGKSLFDALKENHSRRDVEKVAEIFKGYVEFRDTSLKGVVSSPKKPNKGSELEEEIAPEKRIPGERPNRETKTYTKAEIDKYYTGVRQGKIKSDLALESKFDLAVAEGRIK